MLIVPFGLLLFFCVIVVVFYDRIRIWLDRASFSFSDRFRRDKHMTTMVSTLSDGRVVYFQTALRPSAVAKLSYDFNEIAVASKRVFERGEAIDQFSKWTVSKEQVSVETTVLGDTVRDGSMFHYHRAI